jgi:uncharacterized membrane protein
MLLPLHVLGAVVGLASGIVALAVAKGGSTHRKSGLLFVAAMLAMSISAIVIAVSKGQTLNVIAGLLTAYLVMTALSTVRPVLAASRPFNVGLMVMALGLGVTTMTFGVQAVASAEATKYGYPPFPFFMFAAVGLLGAAGDFRMLRCGGLRGAPRLARHLWRMCWALWIATASFFLGPRARVALIVPEPLIKLPLLILPEIAVAMIMVYWLWRVRARWRSGPIAAVGAEAIP